MEKHAELLHKVKPKAIERVNQGIIERFKPNSVITFWTVSLAKVQPVPGVLCQEENQTQDHRIVADLQA